MLTYTRFLSAETYAERTMKIIPWFHITFNASTAICVPWNVVEVEVEVDGDRQADARVVLCASASTAVSTSASVPRAAALPLLLLAAIQGLG